jgi:hypothetical protein
MSTLITLVKMAATLSASFLLARFGRKIILEVGGFLEGAAAVLLAVGFYIQSDSP